MLLACLFLVIGPTAYAFYRYRSAQVFSGDIAAPGQPVTLPTQRADRYTLTLQPQVNTPSGVTLGFTVRDSFGRTLAASTDFYHTGCPPGSPATQTCPAQSRDFPFRNTLGGPVHLTLEAPQPGFEVAVRVRDESQGGIFASGSLVLFGTLLGCGSFLWVICTGLLFVLARRLARLTTLQQGQPAIRQALADQQQPEPPPAP